MTRNIAMKILLSFLILVAVSACASRQVALVPEDKPFSARKNAEIALLYWIDRLPHAPEAGVDNLIPSLARAAAFQSALEALLRDDPGLAATAAETAGYQVVIFNFGDIRFLALADSRHPGIGPTVIVNPNARRELIAGAPHPVFEEGVDIEAGLFVTRLEARAAIIAGAHACASSVASRCATADNVCPGNGSAPVRVSDAAHNTVLLYQLAHETLAHAWPDSIVFSLRGMMRADNAIVIFSDGSRRHAGVEALPNRLRDGVAATSLSSAGKIVSCQDADDDALARRSFCGAGNVQGRFLNGSPDACSVDASASSGRFVHLEQGGIVLARLRSAAQLNLSGSAAENLLRGIAAVIPSSEMPMASPDSASGPGQDRR